MPEIILFILIVSFIFMCFVIICIFVFLRDTSNKLHMERAYSHELERKNIILNAKLQRLEKREIERTIEHEVEVELDVGKLSKA